MKKLNRRDYLKRMGLAAAGTLELSSSRNIARGSTATRNRGEQTEAVRAARTNVANVREGAGTIMPVWPPWTNAFPPDGTESIKFIFHGLMGLCCYKPENEPLVCHAGFHSKGDSHTHHLRVYVRRKLDNRSIQPPGELTLGRGSKIDLTVDQPSLDQVYFYYPPATNDRDFRLVIDMESDQFYGVSLKKKSGVYKPIFPVKNALFYTLKKTLATFRRQTGDGDPTKIKDLGSVAEFTGANVYLNSGGKAVLTVDGHPFTVDKASGDTLEVYFLNYCEENGKPCHFYPLNVTDKTKRNDFYLHYKAIDLQGKDEYQLVMTQGGMGGPPAGLCEKYFKLLNDEAPCAATGYGGGGGLS